MSGQLPKSRPEDVLRRVLEPVVAGAGADLEGLSITSAGRRRAVRVVLDKDGGISLDEVAQVSTLISGALDSAPEADRALGGNPYVLEVSSPGIDRPLTEERHWRRARGRLVAATIQGGQEFLGRVQDVADGNVSLRSADGDLSLSLSSVVRARVQVEFSSPEPQEGGESAEDEEPGQPAAVLGNGWAAESGRAAGKARAGENSRGDGVAPAAENARGDGDAREEEQWTST